ncbi:adenosine deaminase [Motiliproteus sp. MSK22-1]|nr:adenosine deaminase [Motiliproteus sp. MSK22-1]OMH28484.1 adenosine deaminase [Motiliproteus sp. MSK22-1]
MKDFIQGLPKAELHIHLEGSMQPELMFRLAERNSIALRFSSVEALEDAYHFNNLQEFLDLYYEGMQVLITEEDFFDLTWDYLQRAHADRVLHTEMFFDPQAHLERGVAFETVINGIFSAMEAARCELGISSLLILSFLRHLSGAEALSLLKQVDEHLPLFAAVGLDSSEKGNPPEKFEAAFEYARSKGLKAVAHAGEEGPPEYVWGALNALKVDRIDHGNRSLEDPSLIKVLIEQQIPLTICPLSNLRLAVVDDMSDHPLRRMLELGLKVTINSDDPAYFGGYLNDNYRAVEQALSLSVEQLGLIARNSFESAFVKNDVKQEWLSALDSYMCSYQ